MRRGDGRDTRRLDAEKLVELTRKSIVEVDQADDEPVVEWEEEWDEPAIAAGSQNESHPTLPTQARTTTVCDPLTTAMLAEVARRAATVELDPSTVEVARRSTKEIDPDALAAALEESEPTGRIEVDNPFDAPTAVRNPFASTIRRK